MSHIAKELRDQGCMFSQTKFMNDLVNYEPVFKEGKVAFYPDNITDDMMHLYKKRKPTVEVTTVMQDEVDERECTRLERIEHMLERIETLQGSMNNYLGLTVPA